MSWNISATHTAITLQGVTSRESLEETLNEHSRSILGRYRHDGTYPEHLDSVIDDIESSPTKAVNIVTNELWQYIAELEFDEGECSFYVYTEYDTERSDVEFAEGLIDFLFGKSKMKFYLASSAAFDNGGGYSNQSVAYWKDGEILKERTIDFFERLFGNSNSDYETNQSNSVQPDEIQVENQG